MPSKSRRPTGDLFHLGRYFTPSRIQLLWYAYLAIWAWQFFTTAYSSLNSMYLMGSFETVSVLFLIGDLLWRVIYLLLARLFFEVALVYLSKN
jgi:hypothetical protein